MSKTDVNWFDRFLVGLAPKWGVNRIKARASIRSYEAAGMGRRTSNWHRSSTDANSANAGSIVALRELSRDLRRNNGWARRGIQVISANTVGWGIGAKAVAKNEQVAAQAIEIWKAWSTNTKCDYDGRMQFAGLQRLVMDTIVESGEALVVREPANADDGLAVPLRIRVLEPDFLDTTRSGKSDGGHKIVQGIEFDGRGRRAAYWIFKQHPGSATLGAYTNVGRGSYRVAASDVLHVYRVERAGQMRGVPWLSAAIAKLNDFDDYDDARLVQAKVAACFGAFVTDVDANSGGLGEQDEQDDRLETLEPGHIEYLSPGKEVTFPTPPNVSDHGAFSETQLRRIAASLGVTYEELTGDYSRVNFSSARMARLSHWSNIHDWRWNMLIPQFCEGVWGWVMEQAQATNGWSERPRSEWAPPPMPMLSPEKEGLAYQRLIRSGAMTLYQVIRERGEDPSAHLAEIAAGNSELDRLKIVLDSDPRNTSIAGGIQSEQPAAKPG